VSARSFSNSDVVDSGNQTTAYDILTVQIHGSPTVQARPFVILRPRTNPRQNGEVVEFELFQSSTDMCSISAKNQRYVLAVAVVERDVHNIQHCVSNLSQRHSKTIGQTPALVKVRFHCARQRA